MKKRRYQIMSVWMLLLILFGIWLTACAPKPEEPLPLPGPLGSPFPGPIGSQIATLEFPWEWPRFNHWWIFPGWFPLGSDPEGDPLSRGDETPQKNSYEPGFWMGESEVTNKEYALCVEMGVCSAPSIRESGPTNHFGDSAFDDHPVVGVNWFQAQGYCEWTRSRLPTEAEWEKAARGTMGYIYPWGNDEPTCDRANAQIAGCEAEGSTMPTGSYPLGVSPYGFFDMAGNVKEWTLDWYSPDAYLTATAYMPTGPAEGEKKAVRGGGFNDFKENLRTTSRWGYAPDQDFDDVGFRCVPVTPSYAPFCEPSYVPLCYDPDIPRDDEPCVPGERVPGEEGITLLGFGCPMNRIVCFQISSNGGGNTGYSALVDDDAFTCKPLDERPDIMQCCGPEQPMGRNVEITICAPGGSPEGAPVSTTALNTTSGIMLASFNASGVISLMRTTAPNCPDGYTYDADTGDCILDKERTACPENWTYDRKLGECVPDDPEEDCPPMTTFSANLGGCQPDDGECPPGYFLTENRVCEPDQNRGDECPPGYYFNDDINCCEPIPPDNFGCPDGYYWHEKYEKCVPINDDNCGFNMTYNGYGECEQNPDTPGPDEPPEGDCPPGLYLAALNTCDPHEEEGTGPDNGLRPGDRIGPDGLITPELGPAQPDCPEGYYYHEKYQRCIERDEDGCPEGYYFDTGTEQCLPTNGPSSPCPTGYVYDPKTECCVPQPGMDSTRCPEDEKTVPGIHTLTAGMQPFTGTNFDPDSGECEDDDSTRKPGEPEDCPPGMLTTNIGTCDQYPPDETGQTPDPDEDPEETKRRQADCPKEFWNPNTNTCDVPEPECGQNEYFNRRLGYCVPLQDDCCEIGQDYSANLKECVDVTTKPRDGECPDGFELINGLCWLIGRTEGQGARCWTIIRNTPRCVGRCEVGLYYNEKTGRCEEPQEPVQPAPEPEQPTDPCAGVVCSPNNCDPNCCVKDPAGGCVPK